MIISFTNVIGAIRSLGEAAQVITTNLKMWLGFETSETLGREEVVDGDFPTETNWVLSSASISNNKCTMTSVGGASTYFYQSGLNLTQDKPYNISFKATRISGDTDLTFNRASGNNVSGAPTISNTDEYSFNFTPSQDENGFGLKRFSGGSGAVWEIENFSVKELTQFTPDKSGNNNVGELFTGKALEFNGAGDYVDVDGFQMTGTNATFAFWFNSNDTLGRFFDTLSDSDNRLILSFNNNQISILDHSVSWFNFGSVLTNVWNRCVITINGTTAKCFVNGVQLGADKTISTIDMSSNTDAAIGSHVFGTQAYFDGSLSDFQIYNAVWSTDDITYDYANPQNLVTDRSGTSIELTNLKGYWHLSEGAGSIAYDSSGEGNNGTINGATYEPAQPRIPQLGMMNWSKPTIGSDVVTLIPDPNNTSQDILGNAVRDRLNSFNLDGSGYAEVADDDSINPTTEITVQCWIQSNTESDRGLVAKWKNPSAKDYMLYKLESNFRFYIGVNFGTSDTIPTSGWVNIAGTYDGSNIKTYINGTLSTTTALTGLIPNNSNTLDIGRYNEVNGTPYSERISDVLLYDIALDADEVENNYNAGLSAHTN